MRDCITNVHVRLYMYLTIRDVVEQVATEIMRAKRENVALVGLVMVLCVFVDEFVCVHAHMHTHARIHTCGFVFVYVFKVLFVCR